MGDKLQGFKDHTIPRDFSISFSFNLDVRLQLLLYCHACLPVDMFPAMIVMNHESQINTFLYGMPQLCCFITQLKINKGRS